MQTNRVFLSAIAMAVLLATGSPPPGCDRTGMSDCPKVVEVSNES